MAACKNLIDIGFPAIEHTGCSKANRGELHRFRPNGRTTFHNVRILHPRKAAWNTRSFPFNRKIVLRDLALRCSVIKGLNSTDVNGASSLERWETVASPGEAVEADAPLVDVSEAQDISPQSAKPDASPARTESVSSEGQGKAQALKGIFPGGSRRAEVRLPGLVLLVRVDDVFGGGAKEFLGMVDSAVAGGVTMVVLESGSEESVGGARLYEAARLLKALLRGRAELLVAERVDIAAAAGASGVLLSDEGLPAVLARSMMQNAIGDASVLPLVARSVNTAQSALSATASEGADLLILQVSDEKDARSLVSGVCERVSIPVFVQASALSPLSMIPTESSVLEALQAGASGLVFNGVDMKNVATDDMLNCASCLVSTMSNNFQQRPAGVDEVKDATLSSMTEDVAASHTKTLDLQFNKILEEERALLSSMIDLVQEASPEMEEVSLLMDAVAQLDEPFLSVIVGEFNSGKSSVINALLGKRFLKEGVLPTTNEITLLKYAGDGCNGKERSERHPDGHFMRYLSAELLKQMNLVDTPGTNVILQRQQRLTEEFVPRADLVLFVLSADRPLTESEMTFLRYIRQWGKKIIFILNKSDVFSEMIELEDVVNFVRDNAQQLLSVEQAVVYPVSARHALKAKSEAVGEDGVLDMEILFQNSLWKSSGFDKLEDFITDFLGGSSDAGAERRRLKLETPLGIALALLDACERQLSTEAAKAESDLNALDEAVVQLENYQKVMENDATLLRQRIVAVIDAAKRRAENFVDSILRLSNIDAVAGYLLGGDRKGNLPVSGGFEEKVIGSARSDVQKLLEEHQSLLESNCSQQVSNYKELVTSRWPDKMLNMQLRLSTDEKRSFQSSSLIEKQASIAVLDGFDTHAATIVLEQELREVVLSTVGGLGAAGVSASVLTSILPSTLEDLIALGICSAGGLVGVWNLPLRRAEVKKKVEQVADSLARQMEIAMEKDFKESIERLRAEVEEVVRPYHDAAQAEASRVSNLQDRVQGISNQLQTLRLRVQNLGTS